MPDIFCCTCLKNHFSKILITVHMDAHGGWIATSMDLAGLLVRVDFHLGKLNKIPTIRRFKF